jgi:mannose-1-phosphate guanylyltransferase/mannose-6-phosphate isomerase
MYTVTTTQYEAFTEHRPWGSYTILADENDHKVKRIVVKPGHRLSLQRHKHRQEHWYIMSGIALVTRNSEQLTLGSGESVDIAFGDIHRVQNQGNDDVVFIEVQLGDYFGEDDIERFEDDYGRVGRDDL